MAEDEPAEREEPDAGESEPADDTEPDEPMTEPTRDTDEESPVQEADESPQRGTEEASADPTNGPSAKPADKKAEETTDQPLENSTDVPSKESSDEMSEVSTHEPEEEPPDESVENANEEREAEPAAVAPVESGDETPEHSDADTREETAADTWESSAADTWEEPTEEGSDTSSDEPIRVRPAPTEPMPRPPRGMLPTQRSVNAPIGAVRELIRALSSAREGEEDGVPEDVRKYDRFKKVDDAQYERVNEFLRERTYITAREWAIARLCADFRTETGVEMTKIGENLPHLVPFMTDTYSPQAVNQARSSFETKVTKSGATFLYGAMSDFFSADELDEVMYEVTEVAKFLLEVEGVDLAVDEELEGEERISSVMREVRSASDELRHEGTTCPNCGHEIGHD